VEYRKGAALPSGITGIDETRWQQLRAPVRDFAGLAAQSGEGKRGKVEERESFI
jgi:hypothetical protein